MVCVGTVGRCCAGMAGGMADCCAAASGGIAVCCGGIGAVFALIGIADGGPGGPCCQPMNAGSYWIVKGVNREAQEGHWTVGERYCGGGGYIYCGGADCGGYC